MNNRERIQKLKDLKYELYTKEHQVKELLRQIENIKDEIDYYCDSGKRLIKRPPHGRRK